MLQGRAGARFALIRTPPEGQEVVGSIVHVPPFAEEMNKSRRATAVASQTFASLGWVVLQMDLYGCGDSSGEFEQATWSSWVDDVHFAIETAVAHSGHSPVLWAIRAGSLLVSEALPLIGVPSHLLLWQPTVSGQAVLTQFLRMRVAADALAPQAARTTTTQLREQLRRGTTIDVAGYRLHPELALPMDACELRLAPETCVSGLWIEAVMGESDTLSPASLTRLEKFRAEGVGLQTSTVRDDLFWQTQETTTAPGMVDVSCKYLAHLAMRS